MRFTVRWTDQAVRMLGGLSDLRVRKQVYESACGLAEDPEKKGKALVGPLGRYRSLRVGGQRYRILYRVDGREVSVWICALGARHEGSRKDIYSLAQRLMRLGLLGPRGG